MQQQLVLIAVTKHLFILFTGRMKQYKCIITVSICLLLTSDLALYIFINIGELLCVHYVAIVNTIFFPQEFQSSAIFLIISICSFWKKKRKISHYRKRWSKMQNFFDTTWHNRIYSVILLIPVFIYLGSPSYFDHRGCHISFIAIQSYFCLTNWETEVKGISIIIVCSILYPNYG